MHDDDDGDDDDHNGVFHARTCTRFSLRYMSVCFVYLEQSRNTHIFYIYKILDRNMHALSVRSCYDVKAPACGR